MSAHTTRVFGSANTARKMIERGTKAMSDTKLEPLATHDARHTYASLMIAAGVNANALSEFMGHATSAITYDLYGHLIPGSHDEAPELLDAYLARSLGDSTTAQLQRTPRTRRRRAGRCRRCSSEWARGGALRRA